MVVLPNRFTPPSTTARLGINRQKVFAIGSHDRADLCRQAKRLISSTESRLPNDPRPLFAVDAQRGSTPHAVGKSEALPACSSHFVSKHRGRHHGDGGTADPSNRPSGGLAGCGCCGAGSRSGARGAIGFAPKDGGGGRPSSAGKWCRFNHPPLRADLSTAFGGVHHLRSNGNFVDWFSGVLRGPPSSTIASKAPRQSWTRI